MKVRRVLCALLTGAMVWPAAAQEPAGPPAAIAPDAFAFYDMLDADAGWAVAKVNDRPALLQTHDGAKSWTDITPKTDLPEAQDMDLNHVRDSFFCRLLDPTHGWAAVQELGDVISDDADDAQPRKPALFSTDDGGRTWKRAAFETSPGTVRFLEFPDTLHGFLVVESNILGERTRKGVYRTEDGGGTWRKSAEATTEFFTAEGLPRTGNVKGLVFRDATDGWINGEPRGQEPMYLFHTRDAGVTWRPVLFDPPRRFTHGVEETGTPQFFGEQKSDGVLGVFFRQYRPERLVYTIYRTRDAGAHWSRVGDAPAIPWDVDVSFVDADRGWMLAADKLFATADGGAHWQRLATNLRFDHLENGDHEKPARLRFVSANVGWLVKSLGQLGNGYELLRTDDGGRTWTHRCGPPGKLASP